jgi:hypothetical protein
MLIGTYVKDGLYVTVAVEAIGAATAGATIVLERSERPGRVAARVECEFASIQSALRHAEGLVLSRAGWLGAEAEGLVGSPVGRGLAERMFTEPELRRFVHMPARRPDG